MQTIQRFEPTAGPLVPGGRPRFSNRVVHGDTVYISCQVPDNLGRVGSNTYAGQTISVLTQLDEQLREAGASKSSLIRVQVLLRDQPLGAKAFYEQWENWTSPTCLPVRVQTSAISPMSLFPHFFYAWKRQGNSYFFTHLCIPFSLLSY
jgi:enamine deaminase RidA (YjgF/YER057c/UK114 family)